MSLNERLIELRHTSSLATEPRSLLVAHRLQPVTPLHSQAHISLRRVFAKNIKSFQMRMGKDPAFLHPRREYLSHPLVAQAVALPVSGDWWCGEAAGHRCIWTGGPPAEPG